MTCQHWAEGNLQKTEPSKFTLTTMRQRKQYQPPVSGVSPMDNITIFKSFNHNQLLMKSHVAWNMDLHKTLFKDFPFWFQPLLSERVLGHAGDGPRGTAPLECTHFHGAWHQWTIRFTSPSPSNNSYLGHYSRQFSSLHQRLLSQM